MTLTWPVSVVLAVLFASMAALALKGVVPAAAFTGAAGTVLGWLALPQPKVGSTPEVKP